MIRVLGATGRMYNAAAVVPVVEQRISFNGSTERKFEVARNLDVNPNGLMFLRRAEDVGNCNIYEGNVIEYIGNISSEDVREILSFILVDGYYNFSEWNYQQETDVKNIRLDNGLSNPYSSAITNALNFVIINNPIGKTLFSGNWSFLEDEGNGYVGNVNELRAHQNSVNYGTYDEEWNTDAFLDEDDFDDEEDGWGAWDSEE